MQNAGVLEPGSVFVNFTSMPNPEHQHNQTVFFQAADEAVVTDPVTPEPGKFHPQRFSESPRVVRAGNAFPQVAQDGLLGFCVEFAQLTPGAVVELNRPGFRRFTF
jgi:hypothetical protein